MLVLWKFFDGSYLFSTWYQQSRRELSNKVTLKETISCLAEDEGCSTLQADSKKVDSDGNLVERFSQKIFFSNSYEDNKNQNFPPENVKSTSENGLECQRSPPTSLPVHVLLDTPTTDTEHCQVAPNLQRTNPEPGNKVKDVFQKGRDFLKRKFQDYQHKFKSKWDSTRQTSVSSSSETSSDANSNGCSTLFTQCSDKLSEVAEGNKMADIKNKMADFDNKMAELANCDIDEDPPIDVDENYVKVDFEMSSTCVPDLEEDSTENRNGGKLAEDENHPSLDDGIQLGEEALSMTIHAEQRLEERYQSVLPKSVLHVTGLVAQDSFHSDMTQTSQSTVSSVEAILADRKVDPEVVLKNLGFGNVQDEESLLRIPLRFLQQDSEARGIDVDTILAENEDLAQLVATLQKQKFGTSMDLDIDDKKNDVSILLQEILDFLANSLVPVRFMDIKRIAGQLLVDTDSNSTQKSSDEKGNNPCNEMETKTESAENQSKNFQNSDSSYYLLDVIHETDDDNTAENLHGNQEIEDFDDEIHLKSWSSSSTLTVPSIYNFRLGTDESLV